MAIDWPMLPLADCGTWFSGGTPSKSNTDYWQGDIPWVSPKDMDSRFISDAEDHLTADGVQNGSRLVPRNTILIVVRSMTLANRIQLAITEREVAFNQDLKAIVCHDGVIPRFLFYAMLAQSETLLQLVDEASHGTKRLRTEVLGSLGIPIPPTSEQHAIAHILGTLDDKIELNRRMNETLGAMARALFKSWFVDFDPVRAKAEGRQPVGMDAETATLFPDGFEESELGTIPIDWEVGSLGDIIDLIGGGTPQTKVAEYWNGDVPWFSVVDAPNDSDIFVVKTEKTITQAGLDNSSARLLPHGTTIISARGTVGKCAIVAVPMAMNQSCYGVQGRDGRGDYYIYFTLRRSVADLKRGSHGSVFDTITRATFDSLHLVIPPICLTQSYDHIVRPWVERVLANLHESHTLATLRDTLLPKLLSGEIRVKEAEKLVEMHV